MAWSPAKDKPPMWRMVCWACAVLVIFSLTLVLFRSARKRESLQFVSLVGDFDVVRGAREADDCLSNCSEQYPACVFLRDAPVDYNCHLYRNVWGAYTNPARPVVWYDPRRLTISAHLPSGPRAEATSHEV